MKFFVRQPAWVLFMVLFMLPLLAVVPYGFTGVGLGRGLAAVQCLLFIGQLLWVVALQRFLLPRLPQLARTNMVVFYLVAAVALLVFGTILLISTALPWIFTPLAFGTFILGFPWSLVLLFNLSPGDMMFFAGIILLMINCGMVSTTLRSIELNRPMGPGMGFDYMLTLLLFPFGVWFIQPKINRLYHGLTIDDEEVDF